MKTFFVCAISRPNLSWRNFESFSKAWNSLATSQSFIERWRAEVLLWVKTFFWSFHLFQRKKHSQLPHTQLRVTSSERVKKLIKVKTSVDEIMKNIFRSDRKTSKVGGKTTKATAKRKTSKGIKMRLLITQRISLNKLRQWRARRRVPRWVKATFIFFSISCAPKAGKRNRKKKCTSEARVNDLEWTLLTSVGYNVVWSHSVCNFFFFLGTNTPKCPKSFSESGKIPTLDGRD